MEALQRSEPAWQCWRAAPSRSTPVPPVDAQKMPKYMEIERVTPDMLEETEPGHFKWGDMRAATAEDRESAAEEITAEWRRRKQQKEHVSQMQEARQAARSALEQEDALLRPGW